MNRHAIILFLALTLCGLDVGAQQILRGDDAAKFVADANAAWTVEMDARGNCNPPRTSAKACTSEPFDRNRLIREQWRWKQKNSDGQWCVQGEMLDPDQGYCRAVSFCDCGDGT